MGLVAVEPAQAHHARDVLRLADGTTVEVFDDAGRVAQGTLVVEHQRDVFVRVETIREQKRVIDLTVAAAVPKADRADWMVEKLSELGVGRFIPVAAARSVVLPEGKNKRDRWVRLATEAAKQSRRVGVMRIDELRSVAEVTDGAGQSTRWYLSTEADAVPVARAVSELRPGAKLLAFIGPEGGWTEEERRQFADAGVIAVRLTDTVLRVETAAVATAAVVMCYHPARQP